MRHRHSMPFGAELREDGGVDFRLWAPTAGRVELCLEGRGEAVAMTAGDGGWFHATVADAGAGDRYRFRIDGDLEVPDPASRYNPDDVHGPSQVVDPGAFDWGEGAWRGRPWEEVVLYELHVGTFTPEGSYAAAISRLDHLAALGVTAVELMPLADFPGARNWGYDGVLLYAPASAYGRPDELKAFVRAAHEHGLMVFLDVVYNHFGPEGNYLHAYAESFFTDRHHTPWGAAINVDGEDSRVVRDFFINNALYWMEEYRIDGLRLDAVHAIIDDSTPHLLVELAAAVRQGPGRDRHVHLVLENEYNAARYLERDERGEPRHYDAQWNDDFHNLVHVLATAETDGYYAMYARETMDGMVRCIGEGFAFQSEDVAEGVKHGEPSAHLPPTAFVNFLQNHDQVGNRAFGERLAHLVPAPTLEALTSLLLLAPYPPMLFMGEEFASDRPFLFFCDFGPELAAAVSEGRRREFTGFARFNTPEAQDRIPDPGDPGTLERSRLDWEALERPSHDAVLRLHRGLLALRREAIVPRLKGARSEGCRRHGEGGLAASWVMGDGARLTLRANLAETPATGLPAAPGTLLHAAGDDLEAALARGELPPWSVAWYLDADGGVHG